MNRKIFRLSDALKDRVLSDREPVYLGELYDSYLALLDPDNFHKNLFYFHIENVEQHNPDRYSASDINWYCFPYGKLENDCVKTTISKYSEDIENNKEKFEELFSNKKFGIRAELLVFSVKKWDYDFKSYYTKKYIKLHVFFDKEMYVQFVGENDFPVLLLPEHTIYEVK